jgi:hypothetical protein
MSDDDLAAVDGLLDDLERAASAYENACDRVDEAGEARVERLAEHYDELTNLFDRYEEEATGDGDFRVFIEFQEAMATFIERLPEDLPQRERFEDVDDVMQQRRLTEKDFARAREIIGPVAEDVGLLDEREATRTRYRDLRKRARSRVRDLDERIADLEDLQTLGEADLDAPVERLRDPIDAYDDAVTEAFGTFKREESARDVLAFVERTSAFPLVGFRDPPADLVEYVESAPPGTEPIPQLLEYAEYSASKLSHYVDDGDALKRAVSTNQTYLRRLDAEPLTVGWPPPAADELRWQVRELMQVAGRFADDDVLVALRTVRSLPEETDYERLRQSARARNQLTEGERKRLASGAVADELARARDARERLSDRLDALPEP